MLKSKIHLIGFFILQVISNCLAQEHNYENLFVFDKDTILYWKIENEQVSFQLSIGKIGWAGVGFRPLSSEWVTLEHTDFYVGELEHITGNMVVSDRFTPNTTNIVKDTELNCSDNILESTFIFQNETIPSTVLKFTRKLNTGDLHCDQIIPYGPLEVFVIHGSGDVDITKGSIIKQNIELLPHFPTSEAEPPPIIKIIPASGAFWKLFVMVIFICGSLLTFGWIIMHIRRNQRPFKLLHVIRTSFPSSFVLPIDLKTSRYIFLVGCLVHGIISLPTIYLGGVSFLLIVTPIVGGASALLYSPLLGFAYILLTIGSIITHFVFLVSMTFGSCQYFTENEISLCNSLSTLGAMLFLMAIVILFMFEFIAYSFVYRLLRYKLWLSEQSVMDEPEEFQYQNMQLSSSSDKHF